MIKSLIEKLKGAKEVQPPTKDQWKEFPYQIRKLKEMPPDKRGKHSTELGRDLLRYNRIEALSKRAEAKIVTWMQRKGGKPTYKYADTIAGEVWLLDTPNYQLYFRPSSSGVIGSYTGKMSTLRLNWFGLGAFPKTGPQGISRKMTKRSEAF